MAPTGELMALKLTAVVKAPPRCEKVIQAPAGEVIVMSFFDVSLDTGDVLDVYDGTSCYSSLLILPPVPKPLLHLAGPQSPLPFGVLSNSNSVCVRLAYGGSAISITPAYVFRMRWSFYCMFRA